MIKTNIKANGYTMIQIEPGDVSPEAFHYYSNTTHVFAIDNSNGNIVIFENSDMSEHGIFSVCSNMQDLSDMLTEVVYDMAEWNLYSEEHNDKYGTHNALIVNKLGMYIGLEHWNGECWQGYDSDEFSAALKDGGTYTVTPVMIEDKEHDQFITIDYNVE